MDEIKTGPDMLAIDTRDAIVGCFAQGCQAEEIAGWKDLKNWDTKK